MKQNTEKAIRANHQIHAFRSDNNLTIADGNKYAEKIDSYNRDLCRAMGWSYDA